MRREPPGGEAPLRVIDRVCRRMWAAHLLEGAAIGLAAGAAAGGLARYRGWDATFAMSLALLAAAAAAISWPIVHRHRRTSRAAAAAIEAAVPESRNVIVTAEELRRIPERARPWVRERVLGEAEPLLASVEARHVVPLRLRIALCVLAFAVAVGATQNVHQRAARVVLTTIHTLSGRATALGGSPAIVAVLQPPPHTGLPASTLSEPERISAVEGTRVRLAISGGVRAPKVRFSTATLPTRVEGAATIADVTVTESGYLAIEGGSKPRLIPVAVTPDRAPAIKIEKPGRDLLLPDVAPVVAVETSATDDFGLERLALRYTKVSGSGEQFEFVEGELPLAVARQNSRSWRGRGELALARLGLEPGDSLVYRVVARDGRAGDAGFASSETFFIEVAGPGHLALEGFEMPPDRERYGLSQQMIVLKIQRLRERERTLAREALRERTGEIAAEQRAVRANFVFLMGGHVEDEEEEAEHSTEIQEGRLQNTGRREISRAITYMSQAERALVAVDTPMALKEAQLAVEALQRAFGKNRYILRTVPVRSRVDPSRRLTGKLDDARGWNRKLPESARDARAQSIRDLLAELIALREDVTTSRGALSASAAAGLAERALAIAPTDPEWQDISSRFSILRDGIASGESAGSVDRKLREALGLIVAQARRSTIPRGIDPGAAGALRGAWADEMSRPRLRPER